LPVHHADERHTTALAQSALDASRAGRKGRAMRDEVAAQIILQGWLDDVA
jgi:RNase H-fold protein (predicted Holliday junction resolvase)